ncbi:heme lyase CcmF/NrfE family subunit [Iamia sp.]|uniref:heme lyase CcmF/NrfE family subunit n=1 Tax=Iamia sp. TaxID=2722710 RepID=UPI002C939331|nr:heme lyase CcmF/NrfE family subunit [Iamia sp.]HXH58043.1 heme lyase CcmF/NrfE family subunit [Iamia sp.]
MNASLGTAGVALALVSSLGGVLTVVVAQWRRRPVLLRQIPSFVGLAALGAVLATVAMQRALITRDFSVQFVADNGSRATSLPFTISTMWSALEGSILLWGLVLAGYLVVVTWKFRTRLEDPLVAWAMLAMFAVTAFFFALMAGPANPFGTVANPPADGPGPNPLLQDHLLMAFHPPMLYLGYVGFTVPFAFAIGALVTGRIGEGWLVETRRWTLFAWGFLTVGIVLGAWWSYEVLGWGGYWAWDPVENASLLPWLTGTAYLHSVMVQERRGMLRVWNLSLLCATFSLTILGTFLTRSGVLDSVHAFSESAIGPIFLGFFAVIVVVTLGLIGWRGDTLRAPGRIDSPLSREGAFLANNVLFTGFAFVVLFGTIFPLLAEALNDRRVSVGVPYFNRMSGPIGLMLLFLMAIAPALPWRKASTETLSQRLLWPAWFGAGVVVVCVVTGVRGLVPLVAFGLGAFAAGAAVRQVVLATRRNGWRGFVGRTNGGMIVHLGVVLIAVGLAASGSFAEQTEARLAPGDSRRVHGHDVTFDSFSESDADPTRLIRSASMNVDGRTLEPRLQTFPNGSQEIGKPAVRYGIGDTVYLALIEAPRASDGTIVVRVIIQPMVGWLWAGGAVMIVGTALSAFPGKRRRGTEPTSAPPDHPGRAAPSPDAQRAEPVGGGDGGPEREPAVTS